MTRLKHFSLWIGLFVIGLLTPLVPLNAATLTLARTNQQVTVTPVAPPAPYLGLLTGNTERGLEVAEVVSGGPADKAGFKVGDLLQTINGVSVLPTQPLGRQLGGLKPGSAATFVVKRGEETLTLTVLVAERPAATPARTTQPPGNTYIGFGLIESPDGNGVLIEKVIDGSPAALIGLRKGDLITALDDQKMTSVGQVQAYLSGKAPGGVIRVSVYRDKQVLPFTLTLGASQSNATPVAAATRSATPVTTPAVSVPQADDSAFFQPRARLGVTFEVVNEALAKARGLPVTYGALVVEVTPETPAALAGIRPGDIIVEVEGDKVDAKRTLPLRMLPYVPGDTVTLTIVRGVETIKVAILLTARGVA